MARFLLSDICMKHTLLHLLLALQPLLLYGQVEGRTLKLQETVQIAQQESPEAIAARHAFRASYWNWRTFRANRLPSLTLTSDPILNRSISSVTLPDGSDSFVHRNQLSLDAGLTLHQNLPFTGGSLFASTTLQRIDLFGERTSSYKSSPIVIGYSQNLFAYNTLRWDARIEPLRYTEARKALLETLELVAARATEHFFRLSAAQTNLEIACYNQANADTLYRFAHGRYDIGTITENEMLQLELNLLTEETNRMNARIEVEDCMEALRSYLGITEAVRLLTQTSDSIPSFHVDTEEALNRAHEQNPLPETLQRRRLESESTVARARAERGFKAELYLQFGLTQTHEQITEAYRQPLDQQLVSLGIRIPILDWGVGKGQVKVAHSNRDKVYTEIEQAQTDFALNVIKLVKQFNLQTDKVQIARKTDRIAHRRNEVAQRLYLLGKSDILDLNASIAEKDRARRNYIATLANYWSLYYGLRSLTGYDFEHATTLTIDYHLFMQ